MHATYAAAAPQAHYTREYMVVPTHFDTSTGAITSERLPLHRFRVRFDAPGMRGAAALKAMEIAARVAEAARSGASGDAGALAGGAGAAPLTMSFIPEHLDHEARLQQQERAAAAAARGEPLPLADAKAVRITRCVHERPSCRHAQDLDVLLPAAADAP